MRSGKEEDVKTDLKTLRGLEDAKVVSGQDHARKLMDTLETKARRSGLNITKTVDFSAHLHIEFHTPFLDPSLSNAIV